MVGLSLPSIIKGFEFSHNHVPHDEMKYPLNQPPNEKTIITENTCQGNWGTIKWSQRHKKFAIPNDYIVFLQEREFDICKKEDLIMFLQANDSKDNIQWNNTMKDKLESM